MFPFHRALPVVLMASGWVANGSAQPMIGSPPSPEVLLSTQFRTPLAYEAALKRLDEYYDQEVGRKGAAALPEVAHNRHFELWHDLWVAFDPAETGMQVTIKRQADGTNSRLVKGWMLAIAGRLDSPVPLQFKEEPALHSLEGDLYASTRDLGRVLQADTALKALPTWEHAGLVVSASPMVSVILAPAGLHGIHHVTLTAETASAAKQLWNRLSQGVLKSGIYSVYSENAEVEEELRIAAKGKAEALGTNASQAIYVPQMDPKLIEDRLRTDPEMSKHLLAARGQYDIRFRIDKPYRKVVVSWTELTGYSRADGKSQGERPLGQSVVPAPKMPAQPGSHLVARTKLEDLKPGAYRVNLQGESTAGEVSQIDERTYWFDGKSFEEL